MRAPIGRGAQSKERDALIDFDGHTHKRRRLRDEERTGCVMRQLIEQRLREPIQAGHASLRIEQHANARHKLSLRRMRTPLLAALSKRDVDGRWGDITRRGERANRATDAALQRPFETEERARMLMRLARAEERVDPRLKRVRMVVLILAAVLRVQQRAKRVHLLLQTLGGERSALHKGALNDVLNVEARHTGKRAQGGDACEAKRANQERAQARGADIKVGALVSRTEGLALRRLGAQACLLTGRHPAPTEVVDLGLHTATCTPQR